MEISSRSVHIVGPEEGAYIDVVGDRYRFLAGSAQTKGRFAIWEATVPPGSGPPPHVHRNEDEAFYVLEGEIAFYASGHRHVARAGSFVHAPSHGKHWFVNESGATARMLILAAPAGIEALFAEVGRPVSNPSSPIATPGETDKLKLLAAAPRYGIEIHV